MPERRRIVRNGTLFGCVLVLTSACSSSSEEDALEEEEVSAADAAAVLELHPMDIWAQPLPPKEVQLSVTRDGRPVHAEPAGEVRVFLREPGQYRIKLSAPAHEPAEIALDYDGTGSPTALRLATGPARGTGLSVAHGSRPVDGRWLETHRVFLGLRHQWFSAQGRPARRGNDVRFMMDGADAWKTARADLVSAKSTVHLGTWWWESNFEMVRSLDPLATPAERKSNTILGTLTSVPATKRVVVGQFWGQDSVLSWLNTDSALRGYALSGGDGFEFMGQANETKGSFQFKVPPFQFGDRVRAAKSDLGNAQFEPEGPINSTVPMHDVDLSAGAPFLQNFFDGLLETASFHQKFITVDGRVAFVGGMNVRQHDWDTSTHSVFDPRRMDFEASANARLDVAGGSRLPDHGPRKDYMVRIEGPAVQDVEDVFRRRWEHLIAQNVKFADNASRFDVKRDQPAAGSITAQITATMPAPFDEAAIAETWFNAVRNAKTFIYVEDQYFRIPLLNAAIVRRMIDVPDLKLVVVTSPVDRADPGCAQSRIAYGDFHKRFPDRFFFYQLRSFDRSGAPGKAFAGIDTHSKLLIVDDVFMSVGSANKNNRGIIYEGELNVAIADAPFVTTARKRIAANLVGTNAAPADWIGALAAAAAANDQAYASWLADSTRASSIAPVGFLYGLAYPRLDDCVLASIGPDRT